jgi:delta14-sterol reductase/lamin-B receptor
MYGSNAQDPMTTTKHKAQAFPYEFGGPIGAATTTLALPIVTLLLSHWSLVGKVDLSFFDDLKSAPFWQAVLQSPVLCPGCNDSSLLLKGTLGILAWFGFQVVLERWLPCTLVEGAPVKGNKDHRLVYRINAHLAFWVTLLVVQVGYPAWHEQSGTWQFRRMPLTLLYDYFGQLTLVMILLCFGLSTSLYFGSLIGDKILADGGNSGNAIYDFFIGRELNPRLGSFDWKVFCELRPGLIGWMLLNFSCMLQQQQELGYISGSMMLLNAFQGVYVWDALYQERAILTTMDVTTDGFGFMLCFGDLAWVPFTYSLQARYLVKHDPHLSYTTLLGVLALHMVGYFIFRGANGQKDAFRRDPRDKSVAHLQFLQTTRGTKLLTSGWWGMARKINYTGDYIMGLSWCLVCGFGSIVPYYYAIYFAILLIHRSIRDDHMCQEKYCDDWQTYKKIVPYRFIPGIV